MDRYKEINKWRLKIIVTLFSMSNKNNKTVGKQQLGGRVFLKMSYRYLYLGKILTNTYEGAYFLIKLRPPGQQLYWKRSASQVYFKDFCFSYKLPFSIFFKYGNNYFQETPSVAASNHRSKQKCIVLSKTLLTWKFITQFLKTFLIFNNN